MERFVGLGPEQLLHARGNESRLRRNDVAGNCHQEQKDVGRKHYFPTKYNDIFREQAHKLKRDHSAPSKRFENLPNRPPVKVDHNLLFADIRNTQGFPACVSKCSLPLDPSKRRCQIERRYT